jgi:exonuclease SbcD
MKILHTSDLHLGKRVNEFPMLEDQAYILDQIVHIVQQEQPNVVLIAGDVYNVSTPSGEAVRLLNDFIISLHAVCDHIVVLSGNHDSAERLAFGSEIMCKNGVYFSQTFSANPQKITLNDSFGEVNIYLLPFVRPIDVRYAFKDDSDGQSITTYDDAIRKSIEAMQPDYTQRNILVAHQYIKNGDRCDGEESIGGLDEVDANIVKNFDYVALGHLHRPQQVQYPHIRYSGSPLKYSFSEVKDLKSVSIVELNEKGSISICKHPLTPLHDWADLRGTYDELMSESFYKGKGYESMYVRLTLTDEDEIVDAMNKLRCVYPLAMQLQYDNKRTQSNMTVGMVEDVEEKSPFELISEFFEKQNGQSMNEDQTKLVTNLINEIFA